MNLGQRDGGLSTAAKPHRRVNTEPDALAILLELGRIRTQMADLLIRQEELIAKAIEAGHSERAIGEAVGMSGPAINQRKKRSAES